MSAATPLGVAELGAVPCADPQIGVRAPRAPRTVDIWDLRVLRSYLASAEGVLSDGRDPMLARRYVREAAAEIEALSALVQGAAVERKRLVVKRGRR